MRHFKACSWVVALALVACGGDDGAPAGEYAVTDEWWKLVQAGGEAVPGPNVIPAPFARPDSSPLKVTIAEGENTLPAFRID
jgi:hypothetical protein